MDDLQRRELVTHLARTAVRRVAPAELPLFEASCAAHFANRRWRRRRRADEMLGLGVETTVAAVSACALFVATHVVGAAVDSVGQSLGRRLWSWLGSRLRHVVARLRRHPEAAAEPEIPALDAAQLDRLRELARTHALAMGIGAEQAELIADAIVGGMTASSDRD